MSWRYYLKWMAPVIFFAAGTLFGSWTTLRELPPVKCGPAVPVQMQQNPTLEQGAILVHADLHETPRWRSG